MILGEYGTGQNELAQAIQERLSHQFNCANVRYKSSKEFFTEIAQALNIPTTNEKNKPLSGEALKQEITLNVNPRTLFIFPESKRLPATVRYWLDHIIDRGVKIVTFQVKNPQQDFYFKLQELQIPLLNNRQIRLIIEDEAKHHGTILTQTEIAHLLTISGRNPYLARKQTLAYLLGTEQTLEHTQYIDISPITYSVLLLVGIFRFIGLGVGDRGLYVVFSCAFLLVMIVRQLGKIRGSKRKLGQ